MVRLVGPDGQPTPLFVSLLSPETGEPEVTLRVDEPISYRLHAVKVVRVPEGMPLLGRTFLHIGAAVGELKAAGCLPGMRGSFSYLNELKVFIIGELDDRLVQTMSYHDGESNCLMNYPHSPELADVRVACLERPEGDRTSAGKWVPLGVLRPFIPADVPSADVPETVRRLLAQARTPAA